MEDLNELLNKIYQEAGLIDELLAAWKQGAGPDEIKAMLASKNIEATPELIEAAFANAQRSAGAEAECQDLDLDQLERVAGGGSGYCDGTADCDNSFIYRSSLPNSKAYRCSYDVHCDESNYYVCCESIVSTCDSNAWGMS